MSNYTFASMPSVSIARSKFHRTQPHATSFNLGELVILGFDEVIPGSTHKIELGSLIRMSTPIAPIMDDIQMDVFSFFVPMRLTWKHWKNFMGESDEAGVSSSTFTVPVISNVTGSVINTIADDLGIPADVWVSGQTSGVTKDISVLPFRAIALIYNRFFRNQNVESIIPVSLEDTVTTTELNYLNPGVFTFNYPSHTSFGSSRLIAYKLPDYFTSALPYAQKGDPVKIPGTYNDIPVVSGAEHITGISPNPTLFRTTSGALGSGQLVGFESNGHITQGGSTSFNPVGQSLVATNLWGQLSSQVNNTINDLRFAFQLQKALEKDALYGSRYWEVLRAHYAVTAPDASLQDPELLGHIKFDINISQVLQTTGFTDASNTNLGTPGANSVTANKGHLFTASFVEHGYIFHIGVARQKRHTYSQGLNRVWTRTSRFDFYHPVFANIGAQKVFNYEIALNEASNPDDVYGYQEAWAEYRFLPGYNSGLMNPVRSNSLDYWTLADKYSALPTLGPTFLKEDRSNLARALVTGTEGPDFIGSFYLKDTVVNPMPLYSIPGFADHH